MHVLRYAKNWGTVHLVSAAWLEDSLKAGLRQDEKK
jgi:hypothetical protein